MTSSSVRLVPAFAGLAVSSMLGLLAGPELGIVPVQAQSFWGDPASSSARSQVPRAKVARRGAEEVLRGSSKAKKGSAEEIAATRVTSSGPLMAVVSLGSQRMTVYDANGAFIRTPVSTGKAGHRTPTGVFSVIQKNRHHVSNIYSGAPMPFMQRITWSGIALHAGVLPGYPASAGCIRMPFPVAAKLFAMSKMGMRVVIAPHEPTPGAFSHPALPEPHMIAAPAGAAGNVRAGDVEAVPVRVAAAEGAGVVTRFLNPMQNAALERTRARAKLDQATKTNAELLDASVRASEDAVVARAEFKAIQAELVELRARAGTATGEAEQLAAQIAEAEKQVAHARAFEAEKDKAAYVAATASRDAEEALAAAESAVKVADRGTEPIAVFISRREARVFVRQGMVPLFEAPVTFKEPNRPVGTHVFQAMTAEPATGRIGWQALTVPEGAGETTSFENRGPVRRGERSPASAGAPSDAGGALERVIMSEEVKRRISERLWINGSIIISDHGISNETGKGTDFVVLTR